MDCKKTFQDSENCGMMASSSFSNSTSSASFSMDNKDGETSWDGASCSQSLASLRPTRAQQKNVKRTTRVQFKSEVLAFHVDRDFWKFKCESEPLRESKKQSKSLEDLKATYSDKLVNVRRTTTKRVVKT